MINIYYIIKYNIFLLFNKIILKYIKIIIKIVINL